MMTQTSRPDIQYAGLGYTASDAAMAVTPAEEGAAADFYNSNLSQQQLINTARTAGSGAEQSLYIAGILIPWLQSLLASQQWTAPQAKLITDRLSLIQNHVQQWQDRITVDGQLMHAAALQVLAQDQASVDANIQSTKNDLLNQLAAFGDVAVVNKYYADAAAAKAATDAVAAATDAAVKAGGTYIPPGVVLPDIFQPANVAASAAAQQAQFQQAIQNNAGVIPISSGSGAGVQHTAPSITDTLTANVGSTGIPMWWFIAGGGAVLYFATRKK